MKTRRKSDLPTKTCKACGRPFAWRRKWAKVWEEVRYCSDRCRRTRKGGANQADACDTLIHGPGQPSVKLVDLTEEESNRFFEILQDWNHQLAQHDLSDLGCEHEHLR